MLKRFLTRRSFYLLKSYGSIQYHIWFLFIVQLNVRSILTSAAIWLPLIPQVVFFFFRMFFFMNFGNLGKLCCGIAWHHSYHSSVRSVQALFSSHLEYHRIGLQILEVPLVAHSFWLRWIQVLATAGRSAFYNLHLECGLRIELPSHFSVLFDFNELARLLKSSPFFLGNGRLVMSRIGKVSSSMLISVIDSTPMIRSNVGFSLSSSYSTISSWSVTVLLWLYSKNWSFSLPFPSVWKIPFDVHHVLAPA